MNILFFHRLDLVHLYGAVANELEYKHNIIHVAFSKQEEGILRNQYSIKGEILNFTEIRDSYFDEVHLNTEAIHHLDKFIKENTDNRFSLNSSIYLDRTYENLSYEGSCAISLAYYYAWKKIFEENKPDLFLHEPPALLATHLAAMFCKKMGAYYLTQIHVQGLNELQWIFLAGDDANPIEFQFHKKNISSDEVNAFLGKFYSNEDVLLGSLLSNQNHVKNNKNLLFIRRFLGLLLRTIRRIRTKTKSRINPKDHISQYLKRNTKNFFVELENLYGRCFDSYTSHPVEGEQYFFYPMHLEPEAVVLYYADGWYEGQMKLIENVAMQLPPNIYLYVKDHPHGGSYRNVRDYKRLLRIPNLRLIDPGIPGKALIRKSLGVITINGTAGFEALLMNKYVFCFGRSFYVNFKGVVYLKHIKQLRKALDKVDLKGQNQFDVDDIKTFLSSSHEGFVGFFSQRHKRVNINLDQNAKNIASAVDDLALNLSFRRAP